MASACNMQTRILVPSQTTTPTTPSHHSPDSSK